MAYRDDLEAAHARAAAAERRVAELERELAVERGGECVALAPAAVVPERMRLVQAASETRLSWRWRGTGDVEQGLFVALAVAGWIALMALTGMWWLLVALPVLLGVGYRALGRAINQTSITASARELVVTHGPLPWPGGLRVATGELRDIYVRRIQSAIDDGAASAPTVRWEVRAVAKDRRERLVAARLGAPEAAFVEGTLDRALGVGDHPVSDALRYVTD